METIILSPEEIAAVTLELRDSLTQTNMEGMRGNYVAFEDIGLLKRVTDKLPEGSRFVVRYRGSYLPVMGWQSNQVGGNINQRAALNEPAHSFQGTSFVFDPEGYLCLWAGNRRDYPWCRLSFNHSDGEPGFELGILPPGVATNQAMFA